MYCFKLNKERRNFTFLYKVFFSLLNKVLNEKITFKLFLIQVFFIEIKL
jgi:hypothetical protein